MRGAWTDENDKVTLFSAMLHREAVTIAQVRVPDGTNEITQVEALLDAAEIPEGMVAVETPSWRPASVMLTTVASWQPGVTFAGGAWYSGMPW